MLTLELTRGKDGPRGRQTLTGGGALGKVLAADAGEWGGGQINHWPVSSSSKAPLGSQAHVSRERETLFGGFGAECDSECFGNPEGDRFCHRYSEMERGKGKLESRNTII